MIGGGAQKITVEIGGKIAASLGAALRGAQTQVSSFGRNVNRTMNDAATASKKSFKNIFNNDLWQGAAVGATAVAAGIGLSVKKAVEFESAMAEVRKVVDGLDDAQAFKAMSREIISLSREIPITAAGFAEIYAAAGQAGIAKNELNRFARSAAQMGVAFDMTAAQAGDAMAKMRTSMQLDQGGVEQLADAINHLSNSMASSAPEVTDFMLRVGAVGKQVAMSTEQTAAFGSAMIAAGAPPEVAATSFRNLVKSLTKGSSATKRQAAAMADLGLTTTSVAAAMQKDASGTIQDVFKRLSKVPAEMRVALISDLFGDEARALAPLLTNTELLAKSLGEVADKTKYTGSMMREFQSRSKTVANQSILFKNNLDALGIAVGSALLPAMNKLFDAATPLIASFAKWAEKNEGLAAGLILTAGALAGLILIAPGLAAVAGGFAFIGKTIAAMKIGATIAGWLPAILNPVGLTIAAIIGIGAALVWAYHKFDWFRSAVDTIFSGIGSVIGGVIDAIKGGWSIIVGIFTGDTQKIGQGFAQMKHGIGRIFKGILGIAQGAWAGIVGAATATWNNITTGLGNAVKMGQLFIGLLVKKIWERWTGVINFIKETPGKIKEVGSKVIEAIINGLKSKVGELFGWIRGTWGQVTSFFGGADPGGPQQPGAPVRTPSGNPRNRPGRRALGGPVSAGMPYIVGEKRRELFVPGMDGAIVPKVARPVTAAALAGLLAAPLPAAAAGGAITVHAPVTINAAGGDAMEIRRQVEMAFMDIQREIESSHRVLLND